MSDLVNRLRESRAQWTARAGIPSDLETEAADKIEALEAALLAISEIENRELGLDWDEIEEARQIARAALTSEPQKA